VSDVARETSEFIVRCDHIANNIWDVSHRWVDSGECDEVVRCRDCRWYAHLRMMCRRADFTVLEPDGFCKWGERRS
jgi:hypothetical protein